MGSTFALCTVPAAPPGRALFELSLNGQDFVSQREELFFLYKNYTDAPNTTNTSIDTGSDLFWQLLVQDPRTHLPSGPRAGAHPEISMGIRMMRDTG